MSELKCCPICGKEIDIENDLYIPERDWKPTFYDPDSGGDPINIHCNCGLEFSTGTYDWNEFVKAWNARKPMANIVEKLEEKTEFLKDCTKYGNESSEQQEKSYSTMMMYEVSDLVDDLIDIVKQEINNGLE